MTARPTAQPVTSAVPSSAPTSTGQVASIGLTKVVTSPLTSAEIDTITTEVMEAFDVSQDQVDTSGNNFEELNISRIDH